MHQSQDDDKLYQIEHTLKRSLLISFVLEFIVIERKRSRVVCDKLKTGLRLKYSNDWFSIGLRQNHGASNMCTVRKFDLIHSIGLIENLIHHRQFLNLRIRLEFEMAHGYRN